MKRFTMTTVAALAIVLAGCSTPEKPSAEPSGRLVAASDPDQIAVNY